MTQSMYGKKKNPLKLRKLSMGFKELWVRSSILALVDDKAKRDGRYGILETVQLIHRETI